MVVAHTQLEVRNRRPTVQVRPAQNKRAVFGHDLFAFHEAKAALSDAFNFVPLATEDLRKCLDERVRAKPVVSQEDVDRSLRWASFVRDVRTHASATGQVLDAAFQAVRPHLGNQWPLAAATEDWAVVMTWEQREDVYVEFEFTPTGEGGWFCKDLQTGEFQGADIDGLESLGESLQALFAWLDAR